MVGQGGVVRGVEVGLGRRRRRRVLWLAVLRVGEGVELLVLGVMMMVIQLTLLSDLFVSLLDR